METGLKRGKPTPEEIAGLGTHVAIYKGIALGLGQKLAQQAGQAVGAAMQLADTTAETLATAVNDPLGDSQMVASAVAAKMQAQVVQGMVPPLESAIAAGYDPVGIIRPQNGRPQKRKKKAPAGSAAQSALDPPYDPPLPAPPNLASIPPSYLVIVNCRTGHSAAIPGELTPEYLAAGWLPFARAASLQIIPAAQVLATWNSFLSAINCVAAQGVPIPASLPPLPQPPPVVQAGGIEPVVEGVPVMPPAGGKVNIAPPESLESPAGAAPTASGVLQPTGSVSAQQAGSSAVPPGWLCHGPASLFSAAMLAGLVRLGGRVWPSDPGQANASGWACTPPGVVWPSGGAVMPLAGPGGLGGAAGALPGPPLPKAPGAVPPIAPPQRVGGAVPMPQPLPGAVPGMVPPAGGGAVPPLEMPAGGAVPPIEPGLPGGVVPVMPAPTGLPSGQPGSLPPLSIPPTSPLSAPNWVGLPTPTATGVPSILPMGSGVPPLPPGGILMEPMPGVGPTLPPSGGEPIAAGGETSETTPIGGVVPIAAMPGAIPAAAASPPGPGSVICPPAVVNITCPPAVVNVTCPPAAAGQSVGSILEGFASPIALTGPAPPAEQPIPPLSYQAFAGATLEGVRAHPQVSPEEMPALPEGPQTVSEAIGACLPTPAVLSIFIGKTLRQVLFYAGFLDGGGHVAAAQKLKRDDFDGDSWIDAVARFAIDYGEWAILGPLWIVEKMQEYAPSVTGCPGPDVTTAAMVQGLLGVIKRWVAEIPSALTRPWDQYSKWSCPTELPTQADADNAYLRGNLSEKDWKCWTRANGSEPKTAEVNRDAGLEWPTKAEYWSLKRRGLLDPAAERLYREKAGFREEHQDMAWERLTEWVPSPTDAVDWMLKDISDPNIVGTFGLKAEFQQKNKGRVKEAFAANGVSEGDAAAIWMAHWRNMAPHQLYELHKRLRPGWSLRLSPAQALDTCRSILPRRPPGFAPPPMPADFVGRPPLFFFLDNLPAAAEAAPADVPGRLARQDAVGAGVPINPYLILENLVTTGFHVYEALGQDDFPPFWRERLLAISYTVMTRVDMRRAYETNQLSHVHLIDALQDRGYSPVDATTLGNFYRAALVQLSSRRPAANQWVTDGYDTGLLKLQLIDQGMRPELWDLVYPILQTRRKALIQRKCLSAIQRRFYARLITETEAQLRMTDVGLGGQQQLDLIAAWKCLRANRAKEVTAELLCKFFTAKLIDEKRLRQELRDLGYRPAAVNQLVGACRRKRQKKGGDYITGIHVPLAEGLDADAPLNP